MARRSRAGAGAFCFAAACGGEMRLNYFKYSAPFEMKLVVILSLFIIAAFLFFYFLGDFNKGAYLNNNSGAASPSELNRNQTPSSQKNPNATSSGPPGFRGPTGQPRIIGPQGPPPNY